MADAGRVFELKCVAGTRENLRVAERDFARFSAGDRKHTRTQQPVTGQLDERRITLAADDLFVDRARLVCVHGLATKLLVALEEREVVEHGTAWQRIQVITLAEATTIVTKPFFNFHAGDA